MKIKNIFLTLLVSGLTFFCLSANLSAEVLLDPLTSGDDDYIALLEGQGESAYAFDFFTTSMLWTVIAAALVFLMHLGFATLECGLTQSKNTVNIIFKNTFIISMGILTYALLGFNTHYPCGSWVIENILAFNLSPLGPGNVDDTFAYGGVGLAIWLW